MKRKLIRIGSCSRCGKCCDMLNVLNTQANANLPSLYSVKEMSLIQCFHFEYDEFGRASCRIFNDPRRPIACSLHPNSSASMIKGCSYEFYYVDEE
jgi:hypothetical protein